MVTAKRFLLRSKLVVGLLCGLLSCITSSAQAAEVAVINSNTGTTPTCNTGYLPYTNDYSMKFKAGQNATITKLNLLTSDANSNLYVEVRSTTATGTNGNLVGTLTYSSKVLSGSYYLATFTGSILVSANTEYWLVLRQSTFTGFQTCYDTVAPTYTSSFNFVMLTGQYQFAYATNAFTIAEHFNLVLYINGSTDTIPPTFPSTETFTAAENQTSVGTIKSSESATISIYGGLDQNKFSLTQTDSTTAALSLLAAPNFEIPTDVGLDNNYQVVLRAIDPSGNAGYETVTATVTDVDENAKLLSYTFSGVQAKGQTTTLVASVNVPGKVTFLANGKRIAGCINVQTVGSGPITATCSWKTSFRGNVALSFTVMPTSSNYFATTSQTSYLMINRRVNTR